MVKSAALSLHYLQDALNALTSPFFRAASSLLRALRDPVQ